MIEFSEYLFLNTILDKLNKADEKERMAFMQQYDVTAMIQRIRLLQTFLIEPYKLNVNSTTEKSD